MVPESAMMNILDAIPVTHRWTPGMSLCRELYLARRAVLARVYTLLLLILVATSSSMVFARWVDPSPQLVTAWLCAIVSGLLFVVHYEWPCMVSIPRVFVSPEILKVIPDLPVYTLGKRVYLDEGFVKYIVARPSFRGCAPHQYLLAVAKLIRYYEDLEDGVRGCINVTHEERERMAVVVRERLRERILEDDGDFLSFLREWAEGFRDG
jgi:hypothetical protein